MLDRYDQIIHWLSSYWAGAAVLLILGALAALPKVRDGAVLIWTGLRKPFVLRRERDNQPIIIDTGEEKVTFTELLRSIQHDVVKVHAHSHVLGVAAEHEWILRRYPKSKKRRQRLTTLNLISGQKQYRGDQIHFDVISIELTGGREKEIYFDISSFFGGGISSALDPDAMIAKKISELYR